MKRFFERLPVVWKYDSTFRVMVYAMSMIWISIFALFFIALLEASTFGWFIWGLFVGQAITATFITVRSM